MKDVNSICGSRPSPMILGFFNIRSPGWASVLFPGTLSSAPKASCNHWLRRRLFSLLGTARLSRKKDIPVDEKQGLPVLASWCSSSPCSF